jgi:hypothetical protein
MVVLLIEELDSKSSSLRGYFLELGTIYYSKRTIYTLMISISGKEYFLILTLNSSIIRTSDVILFTTEKKRKNKM